MAFDPYFYTGMAQGSSHASSAASTPYTGNSVGHNQEGCQLSIGSKYLNIRKKAGIKFNDVSL